MQAFVHVADDGLIGGRRRTDGFGSDQVTHYRRYTPIGFGRDYTDLHLENTVRSAERQFRFGVMVKRVRLHSPADMFNWTKRSLLRSGLNLPSTATIADVYVQRLVDAARRHAVSWCQTTVKSGALTAKVFSAHAPDGGPAALPYAEASKLLRADIENLAATGISELCNGNNADILAVSAPRWTRSSRGLATAWEDADKPFAR